jgi:hypothetical protein
MLVDDFCCSLVIGVLVGVDSADAAEPCETDAVVDTAAIFDHDVVASEFATDEAALDKRSMVDKPANTAALSIDHHVANESASVSFALGFFTSLVRGLT